MSEKAKYKYVQPERDAKGRLWAKVPLSRGLSIDAIRHKEAVLHEAKAGDLIDAEAEATTEAQLKFNTTLIARLIDSIGTYTGPVTLSMLRELSTGDLARLREAHAELDIAGEIEQ